jgi:hypothetical protein
MLDKTGHFSWKVEKVAFKHPSVQESKINTSVDITVKIHHSFPVPG